MRSSRSQKLLFLAAIGTAIFVGVKKLFGCLAQRCCPRCRVRERVIDVEMVRVCPTSEPLSEPIQKPSPLESTTPPVDFSNDKLFLALVDLLDEVALMKKDTGDVGDPTSPLSIVEARLADALEDGGATLIREAAWNPERQRAVKVVEKDLLSSEIIETRHTGLAVGERIVRKQQVVLAKKSES